MREKKKELHMVGSAHLDVAWFWPWTEGMSEIKSTFHAALERLREYPQFIFTCSSAAYYEWLEEAFPQLFAQIKDYVRQGRWVPTGGWYVQPDVNLPSGEALCRHSLYGQRYYLKTFGRICDVGYNVDSFGHSAMLPQILKASGMKGYVFSRPRPNENDQIPELFSWESADGSQVIGTRLPFYCGPNSRGIPRPEILEERLALHRENGNDLPRMYFFGVGNHGGGPSISVLNKLEDLMKQDPDIRYSTPGMYFEALEGQTLPKWDTELQVHAIGCYTACLPMKQLNRRAQTALLSAEALGALAHMTLGSPQRPQQLQEGWKRVMFNQFHDLICGCSTEAVLKTAEQAYGYALDVAGVQANRALQQMTWSIDTQGAEPLPNSKDSDWRLWSYGDRGTPLVVYNPLPFAVEVPVEAARIHSRITDPQGQPVRIQKVRNAVTSDDPGWDHGWSTLFTAKLPPLGYCTYWLHKGACEAEPDDRLLCREDRLENDRLRVTFDPVTGGIAQILRKDTGKTYLSGPAGVGVVIDERQSDTWGHGLVEYREEIGRFTPERFLCMEEGPVRARLRIISRYGRSLLTQDYILERDSDRLELDMKILWQEQHKFLKLEFPVAVQADHYTAQIPAGVICRPMDGTEKPVQYWVDLSHGDKGLAVANDSSHGCDVAENVLRMSVLRSPKFADHNGARDEQGQRDAYGDFMEQGERRVRFCLIPHDGDWRRGRVTEYAEQLNTPIHPVYESYHKGPLPQTLSGLHLSRAGVQVVVLKEAEEGNAYILRAQECFGEAGRVQIGLPLIGREWEETFGAFEIKTFRIPYEKDGPITQTDLLERPMDKECAR